MNIYIPCTKTCQPFLDWTPLPSYHWKNTMYSLLLTTLPLVAVYFFQPALSVLDFAALFGRNIDDWVVKYCLPTFWLEGRSPILKSDSRQVSDSRQATVRIASEGLPFLWELEGLPKKVTWRMLLKPENPNQNWVLQVQILQWTWLESVWSCWVLERNDLKNKFQTQARQSPVERGAGYWWLSGCSVAPAAFWKSVFWDTLYTFAQSLCCPLNTPLVHLREILLEKHCSLCCKISPPFLCLHLSLIIVLSRYVLLSLQKISQICYMDL